MSDLQETLDVLNKYPRSSRPVVDINFIQEAFHRCRLTNSKINKSLERLAQTTHDDKGNDTIFDLQKVAYKFSRLVVWAENCIAIDHCPDEDELKTLLKTLEQPYRDVVHIESTLNSIARRNSYSIHIPKALDFIKEAKGDFLFLINIADSRLKRIQEDA